MKVELAHYPTLAWLASRVGAARPRNRGKLERASSLTPSQIIEVLSLLHRKDVLGEPALTYVQVAKLMNTTQAVIVHMTQKYGLPARHRGPHRTKRLVAVRHRKSIPTTLLPMFNDLQRKIGATEARRVVMDHASARGVTQ